MSSLVLVMPTARGEGLVPRRAGPLPRAPSMPNATGSLVDDADWRDIQATLNGDGDAYARLVRRHQKAVAAQMWRFTRQRGVWEELVQDVFVEAFLGLRGFKGKAPFSHWLGKIATRVGYRHWKQRDRRRSERTVSLADWDGADLAEPDRLGPRRAAEVLHAVLAELPPRDRLVLTLMYLDQRSVAETAELAGWSKTMVKVQAHRARRKLKDLLERREAES